jgi:hypothetical protein
MWLSKNEEQVLDRICEVNQLTEEELKAVATYNGFKGARELDPNTKSPGPPLIREIQDILKKYADYNDPQE